MLAKAFSRLLRRLTSRLYMLTSHTTMSMTRTMMTIVVVVIGMKMLINNKV